MVEYRKALPREEADVLDFINYIFSHAHRPHDFKTLLPKVYAREGFYRYHYVAVEAGRVRGTVAVLPVEMPVGAGEVLKIGFVGSVSAHPYDRGAGHMKKLMDLMLEDARQQYDLLVLGGQRQRYQYFGFERGGCRLTFTVTAPNVRHALKNTPDDRLQVREIVSNADAALDGIHALCSRTMMTCVRERENFLNIMHSWTGKIYALEENSEVQGYLYARGGTFLGEIGLKDESRIGEAVKAYMHAMQLESVTVRVDPLNRVRANFLKSFAEKWEVEDNEMLHVVNWQRVLSALLSIKADCQPLAEGRFVFEVEGAGRYVIEVKDHEVRVSETEEEPEIVMNRTKAVEFFFSPYTVMMCASPLLKSWLPVPFGMYPVDEF